MQFHEVRQLAIHFQAVVVELYRATSFSRIPVVTIPLVPRISLTPRTRGLGLVNPVLPVSINTPSCLPTDISKLRRGFGGLLMRPNYRRNSPVRLG